MKYYDKIKNLKATLLTQFSANMYSSPFSPHKYRLTYTTLGGREYTLLTPYAIHYDNIKNRDELTVEELKGYRRAIKAYHEEYLFNECN